MHNNAGVLTLAPDGTRDFQVSGSNILLYAEGSTGDIGIGTNTPGSYNSNGQNLVVVDSGNSGI